MFCHNTCPFHSGQTRLGGSSPADSCRALFPQDQQLLKLRRGGGGMRWRSLGLAQVQKGVLILIKFLSFWKRRETSLIARAQSTSIPLLHSGNKNATILVPNSAAGETEFLFQNKRLNEIFRANKNIKMAVPSNFLK